MADADALLFAELNHRVANSFAIASSLLGREARRVPDAAPHFERASAHLGAFALLHRLLEPAQDGMGVVDCGVFLQALCAQLRRACLEAHGIALDVAVAPVWLPHRTCQHLGLIVTELVLNAVKHAFTDRERGRVQLILARDADRLALAVIDDGRGFEFRALGTHGLGLVQRLARMIPAELACRSSPNGTCIALRLDPPPAATLQPEEMTLEQS